MRRGKMSKKCMWALLGMIILCLSLLGCEDSEATVIEDVRTTEYLEESICETVEEEILYGLDSSEYEEDLENILSLLNITDLRKMSIKYLSKTEKKLVKLGASLIKKPDILVFDLDPDEDLNIKNIRQIQQLLRHLRLLHTHQGGIF